ncbi:MAG TPA: hypothetical protein VF931_09090 [Steroidobacteraceae bacterium]
MATTRWLMILTILNLSLLAASMIRPLVAGQAGAAAPMLRAQGLDIVDTQGRVRASIHVLPAGPARYADGTIQKDAQPMPETVLFRLIRADGRPTVKITTTEQGSAMTLGGGVDPTYIVVDSNGGEPSITLTDAHGARSIVRP